MMKITKAYFGRESHTSNRKPNSKGL